MRFSHAIALLFALTASVNGQTTQPIPSALGPTTLPTTLPTTQPTVNADRALIISVDGLRPDLLLRGETPNIKSMLNLASFSFWARTTETSVTLPSHVSMLTGLIPARHGINFNNDGPEEQVYPQCITLFEIAHKAGLTTAVVSGKSKFAALAKPGSVNWANIPERAAYFKDPQVADHATTIIRSHRPDVMFVHFGGVDGAGHSKGWGTAEQMEAIAVADECVGRVLDALREEGLLETTLVILSADHGGAGKSHGANDARSRHIPWIAMGPGINKHVDLTRFKDLQINTEDTFATACFFLGLPIPPGIDGRPVYEVMEQLELLAPTPAPTTAPVIPDGGTILFPMQN